jgi:hypothetical protein
MMADRRGHLIRVSIWNYLSNLRLCFHPRVFESKHHRKEPDPQIVGDRLYASPILCCGVIDVFQLPESKRSLSVEEGWFRSFTCSVCRTLCYPSHDPDWTISSQKAEHFVSWRIDCLNGNVTPLGDVSSICQVLDQPGLKLFTCAQGLRRVPISIPDFSVRNPLGLCLAQARTDDVVAILNRRKYPVLIRQKEQDVYDIERKSPAFHKSCETSFKTPTIYEVVGECYITDLRKDAGGRNAANICIM